MATIDRLKPGSDEFGQATAIRFARVATLAALGVAVIALAGLIGNIPGLRILGSIRTDYVPMAPTTAICFLVLGAALFSQAQKPLQGLKRTAVAASVLFVAAYCALELAELFVGHDLNFDEALSPTTDKIGDIPLGRMSPATAVTFLIAELGALLSMLRSRCSGSSRKLGNCASSLGALAAIVGATVLLAYLYGAPLMYGGSTVPMAATTALAFLFLSVALIASTGPACFPMCLMTGNSTSALLSRNFLPLIVAAVVVESLLSRFISASPLFNQALLMAFLVVVIGLITASVVNRVASSTGGNIDEVSRNLNLALKELGESRKQYYDLVEGTPDLITRVDAEGRILFVNHAALEIYGLAPEECIGRDAFDFVHREDQGATLSAFQEWLKGGGSLFTHENRQAAVDGRVHHMAWSIRPEHDSNGKVCGFASTARDVTARKLAEDERLKLESQLQQAKKLESVGSLAGGVAHDFNNMLSVIIGHASLALMQMEPAHPLHSHLEAIGKAAERSADLTRQLLAFARKQTIAPKVLDLNETLASMLKMLQRLLGEDISLNWKPGANVWPIMMDPCQIDQILANLCVNARDAVGGVGKITIETGNSAIDEVYCAHHAEALPGRYVRLVVSDNGCGMDSETLGRIYEPFFTTKGTGKGTGLGLSTVFGIVKQNHGFINVYSEPDLGTTFAIYLPRNAGKSEQAQVEAAAEPASSGKETILLVEDELAILNIAQMILGRQGYTVLQANTPNEAVRLAKEHPGEIHLLVTDVIMPEMNGKKLLDTLLPLRPQLKCLFMSGYTADAIAQHGVLDDGVNFIQKPFSLPDLAAKVREVLDD